MPLGGESVATIGIVSPVTSKPATKGRINRPLWGALVNIFFPDARIGLFNLFISARHSARRFSEAWMFHLQK
jgi:hypothetical protein